MPAVIFFAFLFLFPFAANAFVTPSSDPLFSVAKLVPGTTVSGSVEIENTTGGMLTAQIGPSTFADPANLGGSLELEIKEGATSLYSDTLENFLNGAPVALTDVDTGMSSTYTLNLTFDPAAPQALMGSSIDFDLCVGFKGGQIQCGTGTTPGYAQGSYGGGGYAQSSYGGGYSQSSYSLDVQNLGGGARVELGVGGDDTTIQEVAERRPVPQIAGESTSTLPFPFGAPNTGFGSFLGGTTAQTVPLAAPFAVALIVLFLVAVRKYLQSR